MLHNYFFKTVSQLLAAYPEVKMFYIYEFTTVINETPSVMFSSMRFDDLTKYGVTIIRVTDVTLS